MLALQVYDLNLENMSVQSRIYQIYAEKYSMRKNRLKYWRHYLQMDTKKEAAEFFETNYRVYIRWESNEAQPDTESMLRIFEKLRSRVPDFHMEYIYYEENGSH